MTAVNLIAALTVPTAAAAVSGVAVVVCIHLVTLFLGRFLNMLMTVAITVQLLLRPAALQVV